MRILLCSSLYFTRMGHKIIVYQKHRNKKKKGDKTMPGFIEADYENSVIELFQNMGYQHIYGPDIERNLKSPLYDEILQDSLYRLNPSLPNAAIEDALYKLKNFENGTLVQKNTVFMNYLQNGIEVSYHDKGETKSDIVYIVDYKNPDKQNLEFFQ